MLIHCSPDYKVKQTNEVYSEKKFTHCVWKLKKNLISTKPSNIISSVKRICIY